MTTWVRRPFMTNAGVPVVPGKDGWGENPRASRCDACAATGVMLRLDVIDGTESAVCFDFATCCLRFRMGMTPDQFVLYNRGVSAVLSAR